MKANNQFKSDNTFAIKSHIEIFRNSQVPRNLKGDQYNDLYYTISERDDLNNFFEAFTSENEFCGNLTIESDHFDDNVSFFVICKIGYKIVKIIKQNKIIKLFIKNRKTPLSDRITAEIGKALVNSTSLEELELFLEVGPLSHT